jgi:predicted protein tyrosine phosphatase
MSMNIEVYGQRELVEAIHNNKVQSSHVISIGNPGNIGRGKEDTTMPAVFKSFFRGWLRLEFFDVLKKEHLGPMRPKRIPLKRDVKKVIKFFRKTRKDATGYAIHCWRGVSRSSAVALGILYMIYEDEQRAVDELKRIRPEAGPHPGLVSYFDAVLGCNLTSKNNQLREIRNRELKEWFMNEIEEGDGLLEELEVVE